MPIYAQTERTDLQCTREEAWKLISVVEGWAGAGLVAESESVGAGASAPQYKIKLLGGGGTQVINVTSKDNDKCALAYEVVSGLDLGLTSLKGEIKVYDGVTIEWSAEATAMFGLETAFKCQIGNAIRAKLDEMLAGFEAGLRRGGGGGVLAAAASSKTGAQ